MLGKNVNINTICKQNCCCRSDNKGYDNVEEKYCENEKNGKSW